MEDEVFNCDALIIAIRSQELIWNYKTKDYGDKRKKNNAWAIVCAAVVDNFDEECAEEKNKIVMSLQKKWKVLRDGYSRYIKKMRPKAGLAVPNIRAYAYTQQLSFLKTVMKDRTEQTDSLTESKSSKTTSAREIHTHKTTNKYINKRKLIKAKEDLLLEKLSKRLKSKSPNPRLAVEEDDDKLFLLSLAGEFRKISDQYKLDARTEIINVIKQFKEMSQYSYPRDGSSGFAFAPSGASDQRRHGSSNSCFSSNTGGGRSYCDAQSSPASDQRSPSSMKDSFPPCSVLLDDD